MIDKKTSVFLIFLAISSLLWLLIKLSKEYTIQLQVPIVYEELPSDHFLISKADSVIQIEITDFGFELLGPSLFGIDDPLVLNTNDFYHLQLSNRKSKLYLFSNSTRNQLQNSIDKRNIHILSPDSLVLIFEEKEAKKVKVRANLQLTLAAQFQLKNPLRIIPDSIIVFGSEKDLEKLNEVFTESLTYQNLNHSLNEIVELVLPDHIEAQQKQVELSMEIEKYTETEIEIPIETSFMAKKNLKLFPNKIKIRYTVSLNDFHHIQMNDFKVLAVPDSLTKGKLDVQLLKQPSNVEIIDFTPKMVEYIIIKQ